MRLLCYGQYSEALGHLFTVLLFEGFVVHVAVVFMSVLASLMRDMQSFYTMNDKHNPDNLFSSTALENNHGGKYLRIQS